MATLCVCLWPNADRTTPSDLHLCSQLVKQSHVTAAMASAQLLPWTAVAPPSSITGSLSGLCALMTAETHITVHSVTSRAEATDVANAVLDGTDGVLLGAETLRGKYPGITVKTVLAICRQAEEVFDYSGHFEWLTLQGEMVRTPDCYLCSLHMCQLICVSSCGSAFSIVPF